MSTRIAGGIHQSHPPTSDSTFGEVLQSLPKVESIGESIAAEAAPTINIAEA
jgi:hypothetical protein